MAKNIKILWKNEQVKEWKKKLNEISDRAYPFAVAGYLDKMAYSTRQRAAKYEVKKQFTLRNDYVYRSINYQKTAERVHIYNMQSEAGSRVQFMADQEAGFTKKKGGKHGVPIPTTESSGEGRTTMRRRPIQQAKYMSNLGIKSGASKAGMKPKQSLIVKIRMALKRNTQYVYLGPNQGVKSGLYEFSGFQRKPDRGWTPGGSIKMLYGLAHASTTTQPHEWLEPATERVNARADKILIKQMEYQFKRVMTKRAKLASAA